ncbi:hypothetical protein B0H10DRAFT_1963976 [Mycena sp. CBHHK59/15]|nr:hypothetical protein B0H10DRAFT_1963976 [Mycena sp. CBHHK59/15]
MGRYSKTRQTRGANLLKNLADIGTATKRAFDELSPQKVWKWLSPRKKQKETAADEFEIGDASETRIYAIIGDASNASDDPFRASMESFGIPGFASESRSRPRKPKCIRASSYRGSTVWFQKDGSNS